MRIDVKRLIALNKFTGDFQFNYAPPEDICIIPLCKIEGDAEVRGSFEIYGDDSVGVNLKISYKLTGQCSYCLAPAERRVEYVYEILYVPEKDEENYEYDGIKIDLTSAVNDALVFSQPNLLLCEKDSGDGGVK